MERSTQARRAAVTLAVAGAGAARRGDVTVAGTGVHVTYRLGQRGMRSGRGLLRSRSIPGELPSHSTLSRDLPRSMVFQSGWWCCCRPPSTGEFLLSLSQHLSSSCGCEATGAVEPRGRTTRQTNVVLGNQAVSYDNNNRKSSAYYYPALEQMRH